VRRAGGFLLPVSLVVLVACQPAIPAGQPSSVAEGPAPELPLVVYERIGGETGLRERWEIYADGRVVREGDTVRYLEPEALMVLMEQVERSDFFEMEDVYLQEGPRSPRFVYALSVRMNGGMKAVVVMDGAPGQPPALGDLIQTVDALVRGEV